MQLNTKLSRIDAKLNIQRPCQEYEKEVVKFFIGVIGVFFLVTCRNSYFSFTERYKLLAFFNH